MTSDKKIVSELVEIFVNKKIEDIVLTPGSRNAPLIISFDNHPQINTYSIVDERSAAFFALGMAQRKQKPIALACTSGTASLNYAPAIAEAYYQGIPLIILTADRPPERIDQGDGQAMRQRNVYANYIKASFELPVEAYTNDELWYANREINEAINLASTGKPGPVHINIPLREPIYNQIDKIKTPLRILHNQKIDKKLSESVWNEILQKINNSYKVMIVCGLLQPDEELKNELRKLAQKGVVVLTETISNLTDELFFNTIDSLITSFSPAQKKDFVPDLVIQLGHSIVSKRIKSWLREFNIVENWQINDFGKWEDTFDALTNYIELNPKNFFKELNKRLIVLKAKNYYTKWDKLRAQIRGKHHEFMKTTLWSDLLVHQFIYAHIPDKIHVQLANSTVVRYSQLFSQKKGVVFRGNRGLSGIEGASSTAVGYAYAHKDITLFISGDISFYYDINAFWNKYLHPDLKIIVLNNAGGDIFRYISGPDTTNQLERFFATQQNRSAFDIAKMYNLSYLKAQNYNELQNVWQNFLEKNKRPVILEIFTPKESNSSVLRNYFKNLQYEEKNKI